MARADPVRNLPLYCQKLLLFPSSPSTGPSPPYPRKLTPADPSRLALANRRASPRTDRREPNYKLLHCEARCIDSKVHTQFSKEIEQESESMDTLTQKE